MSEESPAGSSASGKSRSKASCGSASRVSISPSPRATIVKVMLKSRSPRGALSASRQGPGVSGQEVEVAGVAGAALAVGLAHPALVEGGDRDSLVDEGAQEGTPLQPRIRSGPVHPDQRRVPAFTLRQIEGAADRCPSHLYW